MSVSHIFVTFTRYGCWHARVMLNSLLHWSVSPSLSAFRVVERVPVLVFGSLILSTHTSVFSPTNVSFGFLLGCTWSCSVVLLVLVGGGSLWSNLHFMPVRFLCYLYTVLPVCASTYKNESPLILFASNWNTPPHLDNHIYYNIYSVNMEEMWF